MRELVLVKIGGSAITDKTRGGRLRREALRRLAAELAAAAGRGRALVVGHGSGSFGHVEAARHGLHRGPLGPRAVGGIARTQDRAAALHREVVGALLAAGARPFSLAPSSLMRASAGRVRRFDAAPFGDALKAGLLPLTYGDVVLDDAWRASIASTETVLLELARRLRRRGYTMPRVVWAGETPGLLDASGRLLRRVERRGLAAALRMAGASRGTDVTGGMRHRLQTAAALARLGIESWIIDGRVRGRLSRAIAGTDVTGTVVSVT